MQDLEQPKMDTVKPGDDMEENAKAVLRRTREHWLPRNPSASAATAEAPQPLRRKRDRPPSKYLSLLAEIA